MESPSNREGAASPNPLSALLPSHLAAQVQPARSSSTTATDYHGPPRLRPRRYRPQRQQRPEAERFLIVLVPSSLDGALGRGRRGSRIL